MARTAPVPNLPPIPGMCPGICVAGGGGGSGGGSGAGAGSGGGGVGADGEAGADSTSGDGRGGDTCGQGSNGSCTGCGNGMSVGDPVDVATGRVYTASEVDIQLPGPLPLVVLRKYSTSCRLRDVGLGWGWTHSLAWSIRERRRKIELWDGDGGKTVVQPLEPGQHAHIDKGRQLQRLDEGYAVFDGSVWRFFTDRVIEHGGSTLYFLTAIADEFSNTITVHRNDNGHLDRIIDSVGREVHVQTGNDGRIVGYSVKNAETRGQSIRLARFEYDADGHLVHATDADGFRMRFGYDQHHRITWHERDDSPVFHFVYDQLHRCVETWGDFRDGVFPGLSESVGDTLADGSPAKGILHNKLLFGDDGYVEVVDSRRIRRFFANEHGMMDQSIAGGGVTTRAFDDLGNLIGHTDEEGATHRFQRDAQGNLLEIVDPLGQKTRYERDTLGRTTLVTDDLGVVMQASYGIGNRIAQLTMAKGDTARWTYDDRGLPVKIVRPDGGVIELSYDQHGNTIKRTQPDGSTYEWTYDYLGRTTSSHYPTGQKRRYTWTERRLCSAIYLDNGDVLRFRFNARRLPIERANNLRTTRIDYNGLGRRVRITHPDGEALQLFYDREGDLVELHNEMGEVRRFENNALGLATQVRHFDGHVEHFTYDHRGRLLKTVNALGEITEFERDALGRIIAVTYPDDRVVSFTYDARDRVVTATDDQGEIRYEHDAGGQQIKEVQRHAGQTFTLEREYDVMRSRTAFRGSWAHTAEIARNEMGDRTRLALDNREIIEFEHLAGRETARTINGQARLESRWDSLGSLLERRLVLPSTGRQAVGGEPDWVGPNDPDTIIRKVFDYNQTHNLVRRWDNELGEELYEYDLRERLIKHTDPAGNQTGWWHDEANNLFEPGDESRRYDDANRIMEKGDVRYVHNALGQLTEKHIDRPDGGIDRWRYDYDGANRLCRVETPEGLIASFTYDPWARRRTKKVEKRGVGGIPVLQSMTRFVWDQAHLAHEIIERHDAAGDPVVTERSYTYDGRGQILAHREVQHDGEERKERWLYYVNDARGTPEQLVEANGKVVCRLERTPFGVTTVRSEDGADTPLRFQGQYADDEVGLHYNRYRYYDPELGRYITEDPVSGLPDPNLYRYCDNPIDYSDPLGLGHTVRDAHFEHSDGSRTDLGDDGTITSDFDQQARDEMLATDASGDAVHTSNSNRDRYDHLYNRPETASRSEAQQQGGACASAFARERFSDTEAKAVRELDTQADNDPEFARSLRGGTLRMTGEKPPCGMCQARMVDFAQRRGANVEYNYPHPGGERSFSVNASGEVSSSHSVPRMRTLPARGAG